MHQPARARFPRQPLAQRRCRCCLKAPLYFNLHRHQRLEQWLGPAWYLSHKLCWSIQQHCNLNLLYLLDRWLRLSEVKTDSCSRRCSSSSSCSSGSGRRRGRSRRRRSRSVRNQSESPEISVNEQVNEFLKFQQGWHVVSTTSLLPCQMSRLSGQKYGNTAPKLLKFWTLAINLPHRGHSFAHNFYEILSFCTHLWVNFNFLVWSLSGDNCPTFNHFCMVGAFSHKLSIAFSAETTDRIKKSYHGAKMVRTSSITMPSMKGIYPLGQNLHQKSAILGVVTPHFKSHNGENWCEGGNVHLPPRPNFVKIG